MSEARRVKVIVPIPMGPEGVTARAAQLPPDRIAPGLRPEFTAVAWGAALGDSYHDMLLMDWTVFQAGLDAERDGYAAVLVDTVSDSGVRALRSALSIPVVGPGEVAFANAMMLGKRFTILTMWKPWFPLYEKTLAEYGWAGRLASIRHIDTRPDLTELLAGKEEVVFGRLLEAARTAIAEDGADVIVLGSTTMHQSAEFLAAHLPVPVINPGLVAWKQLEMWLALGLSHSKVAFPPPEVPRADLVRRALP
ncbi:MAG: aspartate/glutamate racemase family protein [Sphingomonadaceae bacterium]|uniref:aspartate/glutamate racemase family protein n=1 Tax=Thermaurantiacus sp. TaxID=2820283 RepID=UPI00298F3110|nr:aspartate/glutamate racemase family protein [Thermaurantiacus sp.]MCS6987557.1 aspartate/glutamate racemase family protein [Sphingomonadaceae bacterium]MDW8415158.1 aspartate/glutamate racemase family protein [Thermaurantiacus sp.]